MLTFWVDHLSLSSLWRILRERIHQQSVYIRFLQKSKCGWLGFRLLDRLHILRFPAQKIQYSMGDMRSVSGESLMWEVERLSAETAIKIAERFKHTVVYHQLTRFLPQDKIALYLEKKIKDEIYPIIRLLCIVRWYARHEAKNSHSIILWPKGRLLSELQAVWPDEEIPLIGYRDPFNRFHFRSIIKSLLKQIRSFIDRFLPAVTETASNSPPTIAVHYAEGIDLRRRSELFWYPDSHIDSSRVLIYIDSNKASPLPVTEKILIQIEARGMRWVCLDKRAVNRENVPLWRPPVNKHRLVSGFMTKQTRLRIKRSPTERWIFDSAITLLSQVEYWLAFYKAFNIKVHLEVEEAGYRNVAQNIALDLVGGIHVGKQRSEFFWSHAASLGYHPDHVFFAWSKRTSRYLHIDRNRIDWCVVSGFPNDAAFVYNRKQSHSLRKRLGDRGARFLVAFYDNMFNDNIQYSRTMMKMFYSQFLQWVLEDSEVGLIIKSKKPIVLEGLPEIHDLLAQAEGTGRYVQLENPLGRLPSDASHAADMAVGIGISSAVTEAVIAGCKGIHCDLTHLHSHPFYQWGYEKIIFDDLERMMSALRRYKDDPSSEPELGDWSAFIDQLDPFRDGRAGERVGTYLRWFLEGLDAGYDRDTALRYANKKYGEMWGFDKVVPMRSI